MIRLFNREYPNYFQAPAFDTWWGDPTRWEIAVLVLGVICAAVLLSPRRWPRTPLSNAMTITAPFVFGLIATLIQIHMLLYTMGKSGWSSTTDPIEHVFGALFSSHVGFATSMGLLLLWFGRQRFSVK